MSIIKELIILLIIISTLITKIKPTSGIIYKENSRKPQPNKLNFHNLQTRHFNHYLHKKHHKCSLDRLYYRHQGRVKKPSRYPTLDKIVDRLDNQIDQRMDRVKITTSNPFDEWNTTVSNMATFTEDNSKYTYITVGLKNSPTLTNANSNTIKLGEDDNTIDTDNGNNKGFIRDFTTSSPWDNEQHDISFHGGGGVRDTDTKFPTSSSSLPIYSSPIEENRTQVPKMEKLPSWSFSRLVPKLNKGEERKKKTTPMPYVAAHEHYEQVLRLGDCHLPKEKVIRVHEVHPDPSKSYSPSCTILHQCDDDTGCCRDLKQACKPKNTTKVELYFFTTTLGKPQTVEKLHFLNHTECECQKRTDDLMPQDSEFRKSYLKKIIDSKINEEYKKLNNCTCPSRFSIRFIQNGTCVCDCFDKQDECLILKKGKAHFSNPDKLCIQSGVCLLPSCEFGSYIRQFGRCPNRSEKFHYSWSGPVFYSDLIT